MTRAVPEVFPALIGRLKNGAGRYEGAYTASVTGVTWGKHWSDQRVREPSFAR